MTLPGRSRTIVVEPLKAPRRAPAPAKVPRAPRKREREPAKR